MERIWQRQYEQGVAHEIDITQYHSLIELLEQSCKVAGNQSAYANLGTEITFNDVALQSRAFAAYLINECRVKKGDRVAIMLPNLLQYPIVLFGILYAGCTVVNINPLYTATEISHVVNDSGTKVVIILANFANTLEKALPDLNVEHIILTEIGDRFPLLKRSMVNFVVKYIKNLVPVFNLPEAVYLNVALEQGKSLPFTKPAINHEDLAFLQYTGGTTGVSKGAMLTHGNMLANMLQILEWTKNEVTNQKQIMVTPLPLYHIFSLSGNLLLSVALKALNVLVTDPRDIHGLIKVLKKYKFTAMTGVNTLFNALLHHPEFQSVDFSRMDITITGGMAAQRSVAEQWQKLTGHPIIEGYGLTEAAPVVSINPLNIRNYTGSIGLPLPSTDVKICNEAGATVKIGEAGELYVKGPQVMRGYWNNPEETKQTLTEDGWLKTGDIAKMNEDGFMFIVDRKKDLIIVSGFNVYPNEVEDVIALNPGVLEVAVIGVPHEKSGEAVKAFVVKKDANLAEDDILRTCKLHLTHYKLPKFIEFRDQLPKSNVGKILRRSLRE